MKTFKDIEFGPHGSGDGRILGKLEVNGHFISVVAGDGMYCEPRENLGSEEKFTSFEIAVFDDKGNFVTDTFLPNEGEVAGWQTREDIDMLIVRVQTFNNSLT